jgi:Trp operon repressor
MPHISQQKLSDRAAHELEEQLSLVLFEAPGRARRQIVQELLTKTERLMLAKRLLLILLIAKGGSTRIISEYLKMSFSTVARFEHDLDRGRYRNTKRWLYSQRGTSKTFRILEKLASIPFEAQHKSLNQLIDEL